MGRFPTPEQIESMSDQDYKVLENRLRRGAERQGLSLEKSRTRDPRAAEYGTYQLVDTSTNTLVACGLSGGYGLDLGDIAQRLRMSSERDEINVEATRHRYQVTRSPAEHADTYFKPTRRVRVHYDQAFRDVVSVAVEGSAEVYPGTLEGAVAALRGPTHRESRRTGYRSSDGRMIDLTYLEERGVYLTQADINRMPPEELDKILREYQ